MDARCLVIFKTHFWDEVVHRQFDRLVSVARAASNKGTPAPTILLFVDEGGGEVDIPLEVSAPVIRSSASKVAGYGIADTKQGNVFWFSNDVPLIIAALKYPGYDYYMMLEYDVVIQRPIVEIVEWMAERSVGFLAHPIATPTSAWPWTKTCDGYYAQADIVKCLNCFAAFSQEALFHLIRRRLYFSNLIRQGGRKHFPNAEAFVATEISKGGFKLATLQDFGPVPHYDWNPVWLEEDLRSYKDDAFVHPVGDKNKYIRSSLLEDPFSYFQEHHRLKERALRFPDETLPAVYEKLRKHASREQLDRLYDDMRTYMSPQAKERYGLDRENIGRHCQAWQSSTGAHSHSETEAVDVLNHIPNGNYSFHTSGEANPWWMVDLGSVKTVEGVRIFNRNFAKNRAYGLELHGSVDKFGWTLLDSHKPGTPFDGLGGQTLMLKANAQVRYLKLLLPHHDCLHLDHVDILEPRQTRLPNFGTRTGR